MVYLVFAAASGRLD